MFQNIWCRYLGNLFNDAWILSLTSLSHYTGFEVECILSAVSHKPILLTLCCFFLDLLHYSCLLLPYKESLIGKTLQKSLSTPFAYIQLLLLPFSLHHFVPIFPWLSAIGHYPNFSASHPSFTKSNSPNWWSVRKLTEEKPSISLQRSGWMSKWD